MSTSFLCPSLASAVNYGLEKMNAEVSSWMRGEDKVDGGKALPPFLAMGDASSVMWNRTLSREKWPSPSDRYSACRGLQQALAKIGASRLVVGHTPQVGLLGYTGWYLQMGFITTIPCNVAA